MAEEQSTATRRERLYFESFVSQRSEVPVERFLFIEQSSFSPVRIPIFPIYRDGARLARFCLRKSAEQTFCENTVVNLGCSSGNSPDNEDEVITAIAQKRN